MEFNFGDYPKADPCLQAAQLKHKLAKNLLSGNAATKAMSDLKALITDNNMVTYAAVCNETIPALKISSQEIAKLNMNVEEEKKKIDVELKDAQENHGDLEILDAHKKLADVLYKTDTKEKALECLENINGLKGMSTGQKIDNNLKKVRLGLFWKDLDILQTSIEECEGLMEVGGDWERRNKLKVYRGIFNLLQRKFVEASEDLLSTVATFTSTELCTYEEFIRYAVLTAVVALDRVEFKKKVIDSSQVKAVYKNFKLLPEFVHTLHDADYATFFEALAFMYHTVEQDRYLHDHAKWWVRQIRIKTYAQFLEPFKSVTLDMMSYEFGVSQQFLDKELSRFIAAGALQAKIDKENGVVEATQQTPTHMQYQEVIKQGDNLINRVQLLSRLLGV